jgi:tRNA (pseudouridine54-N1)-methyltransferase
VSKIAGMSPRGASDAGLVRRFVVLGQTASASGDFSTEDLPSTSGRIDVLLRCVRAALLVSHGVRRDVVVYLVLRGGPRAPRVLRVAGREAQFLRPDERSLALLVKKALSRAAPRDAAFVELKPGISVAEGDLDCVLADAPNATPYCVSEEGADVRDEPLDAPDSLFFFGDHLGFDAASRARFGALALRTVSLGPLSVHTDDAITLVTNELDRRAARLSTIA